MTAAKPTSSRLTSGSDRKRMNCVLCGQVTGSPTGEHVWPNWYLGDWDHRPREFGQWSANGEPILDRTGKPISPQERVRVLLPVCVRCNGILEQRFEGPTKDLLRPLFEPGDAGLGTLSAGDARLVGQWLAKTLLLLAHPEAEVQNERIKPHSVGFKDAEVPDAQFYQWLINGGEPPDGVSLWLHRSDLAIEAAPLHRMTVPDVMADGRTTRFVSFSVDMHGLSATVVVHPGWQIRHPLEAAAEAVRLVPSPPVAVDLAALPTFWPFVIRWVKRQVTLVDGLLGTDALPPLRASTEFAGWQSELDGLWTHWGA